MKRPTVLEPETPVRRAVALLCAALLSLAVLTGCGSDSEDSSTAGSSSDQQSEPDTKSPTADLPDGFPADVPLPDYSSANKLPSASGPLDTWAVMLDLSTPTETPVEDYAAQLEDAGYTLKEGLGGSMTAGGPSWDIVFHSSMKNTLSVTVMDQ